MAVRGEEAAAMLPEPRPKTFAVGLWNVQSVQRGAREEMKASFAHRGWEFFQLRFQLKQEHEPVGLALEAMLAHDSGEVKIRRQKFQPEFFVRFAGGAGVGGFAFVHVQLAAARTPEAQVWLPGAFEPWIALWQFRQARDTMRELTPVLGWPLGSVHAWFWP